MAQLVAIVGEREAARGVEGVIATILASTEYYELAQVPEPSTVVLVGCGLTALAVRRRGREG